MSFPEIGGPTTGEDHVLFQWRSDLLRELKTRITTLESEKTQLQADLAALTARVAALETTSTDHETRITALEP